MSMPGDYGVTKESTIQVFCSLNGATEEKQAEQPIKMSRMHPTAQVVEYGDALLIRLVSARNLPCVDSSRYFLFDVLVALVPR